uniref:Uncharacterized protein n=1 Tax=Glossina brevipalpis TaxID=37001 RepID=A0A1A9W4V6_9MUSC
MAAAAGFCTILVADYEALVQIEMLHLADSQVENFDSRQLRVQVKASCYQLRQYRYYYRWLIVVVWWLQVDSLTSNLADLDLAMVLALQVTLNVNFFLKSFNELSRLLYDKSTQLPLTSDPSSDVNSTQSSLKDSCQNRKGVKLFYIKEASRWGFREECVLLYQQPEHFNKIGILLSTLGSVRCSAFFVRLENLIRIWLNLVDLLNADWNLA